MEPALIETMIRFEYRGVVYRIWREQPHGSNGIFLEIIQDYEAEPLATAKSLLNVDCVNAVEYTDVSGCGCVLYKTWP